MRCRHPSVVPGRSCPACGGGAGLAAIPLFEPLRGRVYLVGADSDPESWAAQIVDEFRDVPDIDATGVAPLDRVAYP